jgi:hypothetical protein
LLDDVIDNDSNIWYEDQIWEVIPNIVKENTKN